MTDTKDEVFCRLAIRQGLMTKEEAIAIIRSYRENAKTGQDIGKYILDQGWMEADAVGLIDHAIANRAPGHVSNVRKRVPTIGHHGPKHPVRHHHHVPAQPSKVAANPTQVALIAAGGIVLLGSVIFLIFKMQESGPRNTPTDKVMGKDDAGRTTEPRAQATKGPDLPALVPQAIEWSTEQRKELEGMIDQLANDVKTTFELRPVRGLEMIERKRSELGEVPADLATRIDSVMQEVQHHVDRLYQEGIAKIKDAKAAGDDDKVSYLLEDLVDACGSEYRSKAESEL